MLTTKFPQSESEDVRFENSRAAEQRSAFILSRNTAQGKWEAFGVRSLFSLLSHLIFFSSLLCFLGCAELKSHSRAAILLTKNKIKIRPSLEMSAGYKEAISLFSLRLFSPVFARDKLSKECLRLHVDIEYTPQ